MAKGSDVRLGPWPDGINLLDKPDQLQDTQLILCENFDIDNTGVLEPRRGIRYYNIANDFNTKYLVGTVVLDGETQPRAMMSTDIGGLSTFAWIGSPEDTRLSASFTRNGIFKSVVQYQNKFWYIPGTSGTVGASSPASTTNTFTTVAAMQYGDYGFVLKDRLFVVRKSTSELFFSKATDFTVWAAPDGGVIQVNPGDNQPITKVVTINNQIIIFKRDSTYVLSFTASPTGDGVLRQVSADQGALDAITYNNEIYCYNSRSVFKFVNGFFQDIGLQLNLPSNDFIDSNASITARINVIGKTLMLGKTPGGNIYAMNLDTGAWTMYHVGVDVSIATGTVYSRSSVGTTVYFGDGTSKLSYMLVNRDPTYRTDRDSSLAFHKPRYNFRTKEYNFEDSETWKRMYSWHLDSTFSTAPEGGAYTYINGIQNNVSTDVVDLVGSTLSYRFRTTSLGYFSATATSASITQVGPIVRGIRALIGAKAPISV